MRKTPSSRQQHYCQKPQPQRQQHQQQQPHDSRQNLLDKGREHKQLNVKICAWASDDSFFGLTTKSCVCGQTVRPPTVSNNTHKLHTCSISKNTPPHNNQNTAPRHQNTPNNRLENQANSSDSARKLAHTHTHTSGILTPLDLAIVTSFAALAFRSSLLDACHTCPPKDEPRRTSSTRCSVRVRSSHETKPTRMCCR